MPCIIVRKCHQTGLLFESDRKFKTHLKKLRKENSSRRLLNQKLKAIKDIFDNIRMTATCSEDIERMVIANWDTFILSAAFRRGWGTLKSEVNKHPKLISFNVKFDWSNEVSNSHSCPLDGETNWGGGRDKDKVPRSYPGWRGTIDYVLSADPPGFSSDYFSEPHCGIHTGSGGSGSKGRHSCHYELRLYASDWPKMAEEHYKNHTWNILNTVTK